MRASRPSDHLLRSTGYLKRVGDFPVGHKRLLRLPRKGDFWSVKELFGYLHYGGNELRSDELECAAVLELSLHSRIKGLGRWSGLHINK